LASPADGDTADPVTTEVSALLGGGACFKAPFSISAPAPNPFKSRDLGFVLLDQVCRLHIVIQRPGLELTDPDPDQLTRDVVAGDRMRRSDLHD
jgi:hypothetical protein